MAKREPAQDGAYPYQASLQRKRGPEIYFCSGTIIKPQWILTAALCFEGYRKSSNELSVGVGNNDITLGTTYPVEKIILHENFNETSLDNNIALVKLTSELTFDSNVSSIDLASKETEPGTNCTLTGWGPYTSNRRFPDQLQVTYLDTISLDECRKALMSYPNSAITDRQLCGERDEPFGPCQQEAGGPLAADNEVVGAILEQTRDPETKIVGGEKARAGTFPYQVSLRKNDTKEFHFCGGSIIRPMWIMTAAHCTFDVNAKDMTVVAGSIKLSSGGERYKVKQIMNHEDYDNSTFANDIALLKVDEMTYNANVSAIALPDRNTPGYRKGIVTGWGNEQKGNNNRPDNLKLLTSYTITVDTCQLRLEGIGIPVTDKQICTISSGTTGACQYYDDVPDKLQVLYLKTVSVEQCRKDIMVNNRPSNLPITDDNVCASKEEGAGACRGDSGGPLVANNTQIGVVSWGKFICGQGVPEVYAGVYEFRDWILSHIDKDE
ncbi:coagulation factor IX-like [Zerene cesonia]|uniref:coagulation factor IX-like n=1 Tax=Zerene cesonia TaxID=33412 RepID=UPI0018E510C4|nr:coagulation factor IX-like [Zerene cesonia]